MPIYAYKCESCGHAKDVLQKMSDALLVDCPACSAPAFKKQLTAAGFQLKGSGWYVTDFRDAKGDGKGENKGGGKAKEGENSPQSDGPEKADKPVTSGSEQTATPAATPATSAAPAVSPAAPAAAAKATP